MSWLTRWHFEGRHERNVTPPDVQGLARVKVEEKMEENGWDLLTLEMSLYHQDPDKPVELKFVKPDGSSFLGLGGYEAVWNEGASGGDWLVAGAYGSTYNYVRPGGFLGILATRSSTSSRIGSWVPTATGRRSRCTHE